MPRESVRPRAPAGTRAGTGSRAAPPSPCPTSRRSVAGRRRADSETARERNAAGSPGASRAPTDPLCPGERERQQRAQEAVVQRLREDEVHEDISERRREADEAQERETTDALDHGEQHDAEH